MTADETLRRVRAAIAYAEREQHEIAASLDIAPRTLERWKAEGVPRQKINLPLIAIECGLPPEFFTADFSRLWEVVPEGMPVLARPRDEGRPAKSAPLPGTETARPQRAREAS